MYRQDGSCSRASQISFMFSCFLFLSRSRTGAGEVGRILERRPFHLAANGSGCGPAEQRLERLERRRQRQQKRPNDSLQDVHRHTQLGHLQWNTGRFQGFEEIAYLQRQPSAARAAPVQQRRQSGTQPTRVLTSLHSCSGLIDSRLTTRLFA